MVYCIRDDGKKWYAWTYWKTMPREVQEDRYRWHNQLNPEINNRPWSE
jgi:hypothetical protein